MPAKEEKRRPPQPRLPAQLPKPTSRFRYYCILHFTRVTVGCLSFGHRVGCHRHRTCLYRHKIVVVRALECRLRSCLLTCKQCSPKTLLPRSAPCSSGTSPAQTARSLVCRVYDVTSCMKGTFIPMYMPHYNPTSITLTPHNRSVDNRFEDRARQHLLWPRQDEG